jgi:hypothetical protein
MALWKALFVAALLVQVAKRCWHADLRPEHRVTLGARSSDTLTCAARWWRRHMLEQEGRRCDPSRPHDGNGVAALLVSTELAVLGGWWRHHCSQSSWMVGSRSTAHSGWPSCGSPSLVWWSRQQ